MRHPVAHGCASLAVALAVCGVARADQGEDPPLSPKKYALMIGINFYENETVLQGVVPLDYAHKDVEALSEILKNNGHEVVALVDKQATRDSILDELYRLRDVIKGTDSFVLFFAGHGVRDRSIDKTYWLTHNTNLRKLDHDGIRLDHLLDYVRDLKAERKLVLLDHCFSGDVEYEVAQQIAEAGGGPGTRQGPVLVDPRQAARIDAGSRKAFRVGYVKPQIVQGAGGLSTPKLVVLAAAKNAAYEAKFEGSQEGHGVFTQALLNAFSTRRADGPGEGAGVLSITELVGFLGPEVRRLAGSIGAAQELVDVVETPAAQLSDFARWEVVELPPEGSEARRLSDQWMDELTSWRAEPENEFKLENYLRCQEALEAWVKSVDESKPLAARHLRVKRLVEEYMTQVARGRFSIKACVKALQAEMR